MTGKAFFPKAQKQVGKGNPRVRIYPFIDAMAAAYAAADLVVARAGASSTAEIALMAKPAILVPYPHATDNHQEMNAQAFARAGAAILLKDEECTGVALFNEIKNLIDDEAKRARMSGAAQQLATPLSAEAIVEELMAIVFKDS